MRRAGPGDDLLRAGIPVEVGGLVEEREVELGFSPDFGINPQIFSSDVSPSSSACAVKTPGTSMRNNAITKTVRPELIGPPFSQRDDVSRSPQPRSTGSVSMRLRREVPGGCRLSGVEPIVRRGRIIKDEGFDKNLETFDREGAQR